MGYWTLEGAFSFPCSSPTLQPACCCISPLLLCWEKGTLPFWVLLVTCSHAATFYMLVDLERWKYNLLKPLSFMYLGFSGCPLSLTLDLYSCVISWKAFLMSSETVGINNFCVMKRPMSYHDLKSQSLSFACSWISWPGPVSAGTGKRQEQTHRLHLYLCD